MAVDYRNAEAGLTSSCDFKAEVVCAYDMRAL